MRSSRYLPTSRLEILVIFILLSILLIESISIILIVYNCDQNNQRNDPEAVELLRVVPSRVDVELLSLNTHRAETTNCETIHLAQVIGGYNSTRSFYVLLKSILFYRTQPLHLHLFVDKIARNTLSTLVTSWSVPDLDITFYNVTQYEDEVRWIPNQHYSQSYGLIKLVIMSILDSKVVPKVILLDTDMLALGDIALVWKQFEKMASKISMPAIFGMVENQSDWYMSNSPRLSQSVWPAIGRGFNSGILMVNLKDLRRHYNWAQLWRSVAETELASLLSTPLADQDIFNAVIRQNSHMVHVLPCNFNLQLSEHSKLNEVCPGLAESNDKDFKLIHWNSPYKQRTRNPSADRYQLWHETFVNWNGKLLRQPTGCVSAKQTTQVSSDSGRPEVSIATKLCEDIRPRPNEKLRIYLNFFDFDYKSDKWDVSLILHLSYDRLQMLSLVAANWPGPMSIAIYLAEMETSKLVQFIQGDENLSVRRNIAYHLIFQDDGVNYPINRMRNIAMQNSRTDMVFVSDVDFVPSQNSYNHIRGAINGLSTTTTATSDEDFTSRSTIFGPQIADPLQGRALVVPAFETFQYKFEFPKAKAELVTQLNLGSISMFREQLWPQGHSPTDYAKWKVSTISYKVQWQFDYEPFIVTSRHVPEFDERFVGFGWNKVQSTMKLAALGYEFIVLPEAFLIHQIHSASYDILKHRESAKYRACIRQLRRDFIRELARDHPDFIRRHRSRFPDLAGQRNRQQA